MGSLQQRLFYFAILAIGELAFPDVRDGDRVGNRSRVKIYTRVVQYPFLQCDDDRVASVHSFEEDWTESHRFRLFRERGRKVTASDVFGRVDL